MREQNQAIYELREEKARSTQPGRIQKSTLTAPIGTKRRILCVYLLPCTSKFHLIFLAQRFVSHSNAYQLEAKRIMWIDFPFYLIISDFLRISFYILLTSHQKCVQQYSQRKNTNEKKVIRIRSSDQLGMCFPEQTSLGNIVKSC